MKYQIDLKIGVSDWSMASDWSKGVSESERFEISKKFENFEFTLKSVPSPEPIKKPVNTPS